MPATAGVAAAFAVAAFSVLGPLFQRSWHQEGVPAEEVGASPTPARYSAPASPAFRGAAPPPAPPPCPEHPCAQALPLHRAALRWVALYPGWAPEILFAAVLAAVILVFVARRWATKRVNRRPKIRYAGRVVPAAHARPALLG